MSIDYCYLMAYYIKKIILIGNENPTSRKIFPGGYIQQHSAITNTAF